VGGECVGASYDDDVALELGACGSSGADAGCEGWGVD
jgi:hypothetical protein